ncbi:MAG: arginine decarboxylase, pyruvoyl-dependent [Thermoplasmata archaeon]|nr:MAG: arginine decarboxylase, pyruvoyl-dependent [Thermoplasmata archaeon]HDO69382.1 arginine decarboxylase, pyruvoyl-dependent [Thermoplasmatales archaeon]HEX17297.1 arginine decarboxylase, pyruvoyl-dependent [Thermoplasmatales archaeon]
MIPKAVFLTKGVGIHKDRLQSFELALRDAGIGMCNLVKVSSILPPNCKIISRERGIRLLKPGEITYCVLSKNETNEPYRKISASIGLAIPKDKNAYGYISEYHSFGEGYREAGDYAEDLAATMLATTLGIDFDPDKAWDERKQLFRMSGKIVRTRSITQTAIGDKEGRWTTVVAAAVFLDRLE